MAILLNLNETLGSDWDIYLITLLSAILGMIVYYRRPQPQPLLQQQQQNVQQQQQNNIQQGVL